MTNSSDTALFSSGRRAFASTFRAVLSASVSLLFLLCSYVRCGAGEAEAVHVRGGLPNAYAKAAEGDVLRVAYLGGSITAAAGWRVFATEYLKERFPKARIEEIFAAVPGSGSDLGACRLERDVLSRQPDLMFVEFAVNDGAYPTPLIQDSMEGIVRQTWGRSPGTDICFVYTLSANMVPDLQAGRLPRSAAAMEAVAEHYSIPSVHFGPEVARRASEGTLIFKAPASETSSDGRDGQGRLVFTNDGTHPLAGGHAIYAEVLRGALSDMWRAGASGPHGLGATLSRKAWEKAGMIAVEALARAGEWMLLSPDDPRLAGQPGGIAPPTLASDKPGSSVSLKFRGTILGIVGMKGPDCGPFEVVVDDGAPERGTLHDSYSVPGHYRLRSWFLPRALPEGEHRVTIRVAQPGNSDAGGPFFYLSGVLIVGDAHAVAMP